MKKMAYVFVFFIITLLFYIKYEDILRNKLYIYDFKEFYNLESNLDVIFLGTSHIQFSMSPMEIWNKYGIITYNRATPSQHYKLTYFLEKEIFQLYKPKLLIIDIYYLLTLTDYNRNKRADITLYGLNNKYSTYLGFKEIFGYNTNEVFKKMNITNIFHTRWKELTRYDFEKDKFWYGRFFGTYTIFPEWQKMHMINKQKIPNIIQNSKKSIIDNETLTYIDKIVSIAKNNNTSVLFINTPTATFDNDILSLLSSFNTYASTNNIDFVDYNTMTKKLNLDYASDFLDKLHLNLYGSRKVMDHLIPYIIEHYNIPNRKNDPAYASWNEDYIKYARAINREEIRELKSFDDWKKQAFYDNYTVLLSTNGDVLKKLPDTLKNNLKSFGLTKYNTDKPNMRYAAIIDDNKVFFEEISNKPVIYKGRMKNIVNLLIKSDGKSTINVSGKPRSKNKYGLNFVIYDKINREIVDSIWIDPNKPDVVRR